jgi:hypothetical protein
MVSKRGDWSGNGETLPATSSMRASAGSSACRGKHFAVAILNSARNIEQISKRKRISKKAEGTTETDAVELGRRPTGRERGSLMLA